MSYEFSQEDYEKHNERFEHFTPFMTGDIAKIKEMIALGFNLNTALLDPDDMYISTPLLIAGYNGELETVKFLIDNGADPRLKIYCNYGCGFYDSVNLLLTLDYQDSLDVLKYVIENGAAEDLNVPITQDNITILDASSGETKEYLKSVGAKTAAEMNHPSKPFEVLQPWMTPYTGWKDPYTG